MANRVKQGQDTSITWAETAAADETISLAGLSNSAGRSGDEHDFGSTSASYVRIMLETACTAAPSGGATVDVYWSSSADGTDYDGECTGGDTAYATDDDDLARLWYVGSLICSNTTAQMRKSWNMALPARYGLPVVYNLSGQALVTVTATTSIVVTPLVDEVQ